MKKMLGRRFTLVELLIIMAVLAILMTIALSTWGYVSRKNKDAKTQAVINMLRIGLENYRATYGYYPQTGGEKQVFHLDLSDPTAPKMNGNVPNPLNNSNNFNSYIDYTYMTNPSQSKQENGVYNIIDGYGNYIYYTCPGKINYATFDLQSFGQNGVDDAGDDDGDDVTNYTKN